MKNNSTIIEVRRADNIGGQETKAEVDELQSFVKKKLMLDGYGMPSIIEQEKY